MATVKNTKTGSAWKNAQEGAVNKVRKAVQAFNRRNAMRARGGDCSR